MKLIKRFFVVLVAFFMLATNTSCFAKAFEEEINVVFMYEDEYISHDTVTQFKNIKCPELSEAYIPDGYKFFGWTPYNPDTVKATDENFDQKYISAGGMVHWADVEEHKENSTVILKALMIDKNEIPKVYHYAVIAWYNKPATSGLNDDNMAIVENSLKTYLKNNGVSDEDINTILFRGYTGNVGTSCGQIMKDDDVDIMFGWSSVSNVTSTGGMKESMLLDQVTDFVVDAEHTRSIYRLTEKETAITVFDWLKSGACRGLFA